MNNLTAVAKHCKPDQVLAAIEARHPRLHLELEYLINIPATYAVSVYSAPEAIEYNAQLYRRTLASLPADAEIEDLAALVRKALDQCTEGHVKRQVALLIGSFPNANPTSPELYISALVSDLLDSRIPDAVTYLVFQHIRRTKNFLPTIAEVFDLASREVKGWQRITTLPEELKRNRAWLLAQLEELTKLTELREARLTARAAAIEHNRLPPAPRYRCCYPSLLREFDGNTEVLELLTRLDADNQGIASSTLATKGREAAEAMIRKRAGAMP